MRRNRYFAKEGHSIKIRSFTSLFASCLFNRTKISIKHYRERKREREKWIASLNIVILHVANNSVTSIYRTGLKTTRGKILGSSRTTSANPSFFFSSFFVPRLIYTSTSHCRLSRVSTSLRSAPPFMTAVKSSLQRIVTEIDGVKSERQPLLIDIKVKPY